jgi:aspartyl aminopeptidase
MLMFARSHSPAVSHSPTCITPAGTVDVGVPQLSMHSIREMCGVDDVLNCKLLAQHFLADFRELDSNFGQ